MDTDEPKIRDASGKFISAKTDPLHTVSKTAQVSGPITVVREAVNDPSLDKPLLSVQINNPFRKLLLWIKEIKNKQTTTFEFKIKIPLIALPIFLVVLGSAFTFFFNLGKDTQKNREPIVATASITPTASTTAVLVSKVGVVKGTYQVLGLMAQVIETPIPTSMPTNTPTPTPTLTPTSTPPPSRYVLLDKDEGIIFLLTAKSIRIDKYIDKRVLVTGMYNETEKTMEIKKSSDIEVLP